MHCKEIEELKYLKPDELSDQEKRSLHDHLADCEKCRLEYEENLLFMQTTQFKSPSVDPRFLEARVLEKLSNHKNEKSIKKSNSFRRHLLKTMAIASVFFFIIFSVEQFNTVKKISKLEQKLSATNNYMSSSKGQILVLNHFYDREELKQLFTPDINGHLNIGSSMSFHTPNKLNINRFNKNDKKVILKALESVSIGNVITKGNFFGNPQLLRLSIERN